MKKLLLMVIPLFVPLFGTSQPMEKACFSVPGGFYEESFSLEIYPFYQQHHIRFTTNGNRPTAQSRLYTEPLLLDERLYSTADLYTIQNAPDHQFYLPESVQHCIVIRAAVFDQDENCISEVATNSYFIRSLGCDTHGMPAVSLCADSLDLFDHEQGIFVPGIHFDPLDSDWTGNYYQQGDLWERLANVEFYERNNEGVNQRAGLRTHGGNGRRLQQKCMKLFARDDYGKKHFDYRFFESVPNQSFKHLVLKPFGSSWDESGVNDHLCNQIAMQLNLEALASRPVVTYLNGEYWGVYYLHESPDERYLEEHDGVDIDQVNLISNWFGMLEHGSNDNFNRLYDWVQIADLTQPEEYDIMASKIDIENFIDYQVFELFSENLDWPANNMRCWQVGGGRWRWFFYDGDACLRGFSYKAFDNAVYVGDETWPSSEKSTLFLRKLLENNTFKTKFSDRFYELLDSAFDYSVTGPMLDAIRTTLEPEIPFQSDRFNYPENIAHWEADMENIKSFLRDRKFQILEPLNTFLEGPELPQISSFQCHPNPTSGEIHVLFDSETSGICEMAIFDVVGRKVFSDLCYFTQGNNEIHLTPSLVPGIYVIRIGDKALKLVKQ